VRRARDGMTQRIIQHAEKSGQRISTREAESKASEIARRNDRRESEKK
jgi:hypothetical protein